MNSIKIEKGAIESLKKVIRLHEKMDEFLQSNDKEPSWDGDIFLYSCNDLKVENILYKISTQVKGKNKEELLNRKRITYPVEYKYLRNYFNDNGVCYFVIIISNDGERTTIFYNALTPIKLQELLKKSEQKKPDQTKSIVLNRLEGNDKDKLYNDLLQFGYDSKEQGARELIRKSISIDDINKIDDMRVTTFVSDDKEVIEKVASGEACLFGHLLDVDIWLPFGCETQKKMKFEPCLRWNGTFREYEIPCVTIPDKDCALRVKKYKKRIDEIVQIVTRVKKVVGDYYAKKNMKLEMLKEQDNKKGYMPTPFEIAEAFGIRCVFKEIDGMCSYFNRISLTIYISDKYSSDNDITEFLCALELGHFFLHNSLSLTKENNVTYKYVIREAMKEYEANIFAISLLPRIMVGEQWEIYSPEMLNRRVRVKVFRNGILKKD